MNEKILAFIRECGFFFYATTEGDQPHVRPLGYIDEIDGKLVISISTVKPMAKQTLANPKFEICASTHGKWMRICGKALPITDMAVLNKMYEHPVLHKNAPSAEAVGGFTLEIEHAACWSLAGEHFVLK